MDKYEPFNIIIGSTKTNKAYYLCNVTSGNVDRPDIPITNDPIPLQHNKLYGLSNGFLLDQWPKVKRGIDLLESGILEGALSTPTSSSETSENPRNTMMFNVMKDSAQQDYNNPLITAEEHRFSSVFVQPFELVGQPYATRTTTILSVDSNQRVLMEERNWIDNANTSISFDISSREATRQS
ncbi:hypothetical protein SAMD00019534_046410 [Acytostelium subglobosum LB1]|uniref:hypothetical protein n=1 Tax=Acytostelium subglobosum LB1 TaxID=1410327 RepID=UPI0006448921|nr:hypothetical protein SAMD00019534_046410 [Acytostelium subglobosum LB1]GAM21466.1 hypothetical protein SAMD00019534_046410 [Acytostelium subglobosum LB1]|eukprot:XP_012755585.1 hypothetical protein SAMD00019534_046410 [Acytostelium subglobosum LB1]